jgi:hypothetical protein
LEKTILALKEMMPHSEWNSWLRKYEDYNNGIPKEMPEKRDYRLVETVDLPNDPKSFALLPDGKIASPATDRWQSWKRNRVNRITLLLQFETKC